MNPWLILLLGTIVGYNFVKYDALARAKKKQMRNELKLIALLSLFSLFELVTFLNRIITQIVSICVLILLLYTLPFFPNRKMHVIGWSENLHIVALCW
jgi:fatty acid desaturase